MTVREETRVLARTAPKGQRTGPHWWALLGAGAAVVLVGVLLALFSVGGTDRTPSEDAVSGGSEDGAAGAAGSGGQPQAGFPRTEQGAVDAAVAYLAAFADPAMYRAEHRSQVLQQILDPAVAGELAPRLDQVFLRASANLGIDAEGRPETGELVSRASVLGTEVWEFFPDRAVVAVWQVGLLGVAGEASPLPVSATYSTDTVTLVWADGGWRWHELTRVDGPVPTGSNQVPSAPELLVDAQARFAPYGSDDGS